MNKNIVAVLVLILTGLLYPTILQGLISDTQNLKSDIASLEETLQKAKDFIEIRNDLIERSESFTRAEIDRLEEVLPEKVDTTQLALDIERLGEQSGIILRGGVDISVPGAETTNQQGRRNNRAVASESSAALPVSMNLGFMGRYQNLERFLESLSNSLTLFDVESISFSSGETDIYDFSLTIKTYQLNTALISN